MAFKPDEYDPEFLAAYEEAEFKSQYRSAVRTALREIDRARQTLIKAQNDLVDVLRHSNEHTREVFAQFYSAGGVTADDWSLHNRRPITPTLVRDHGQLRVVRGRAN